MAPNMTVIVSFVSNLWGWRIVIFQLFGFYCTCLLYPELPWAILGAEGILCRCSGLGIYGNTCFWYELQAKHGKHRKDQKLDK